MVNVEVSKGGNETTANLLRRFSRRVQESGVLRKARDQRYHERPFSENVQKRRAVEASKRRAERERLAKMGQLTRR